MENLASVASDEQNGPGLSLAYFAARSMIFLGNNVIPPSRTLLRESWEESKADFKGEVTRIVPCGVLRYISIRSLYSVHYLMVFDKL